LLAESNAMEDWSVLYIEVPFKGIMRDNVRDRQTHNRHLHEHINFYSEASLEALITSCGFEMLARNVFSANVAGSDVHILQAACRLGGSIKFEL